LENLLELVVLNELKVSDVLRTTTSGKQAFVFVLFSAIKAVGVHSSQVKKKKVKFCS
jgi:hypothetical protein